VRRGRRVAGLGQRRPYWLDAGLIVVTPLAADRADVCVLHPAQRSKTALIEIGRTVRENTHSEAAEVGDVLNPEGQTGRNRGDLF